MLLRVGDAIKSLCCCGSGLCSLEVLCHVSLGSPGLAFMCGPNGPLSVDSLLGRFVGGPVNRCLFFNVGGLRNRAFTHIVQGLAIGRILHHVLLTHTDGTLVAIWWSLPRLRGGGEFTGLGYRPLSSRSGQG